MQSSFENQALICEQCGAPLQSRSGESGCLRCLLSTALEAPDETAESQDELVTRSYHHYEILTLPDGSRWELGRGAMGVTYKARDVNLNTPVALKIINSKFSARHDARRRFLREAQAAAGLRHPNVASVFHFGAINTLPEPIGLPKRSEDAPDVGDCFYAMEYIEGESLESRVRRQGPLPTLAALEIARQVARALAAAEKRHLVHRDLKPSNIMLAEEATPDDRTSGESPELWVKVIDFGLAKAVNEDIDSDLRSRFLGKVGFTRPDINMYQQIDASLNVI